MTSIKSKRSQAATFVHDIRENMHRLELGMEKSGDQSSGMKLVLKIEKFETGVDEIGVFVISVVRLGPLTKGA